MLTELMPPIPIEVYIFPKLYLLSFLVLPLVIIDSRSKVLLFLAIFINLSCIFWIDAMNEAMGVGLDFNTVSFATFNRLNYLALFPVALLIFGFLFLNSINNKSEDQILTQNKKLEKASHKIELINNDLTASIEYAQRIQEALLPEKDKLKNYFKDSFTYYKPRDVVSGDFYFLKETSINETPCIVLAAADCTGHGVPGGFMSVLSMSLLNDIVRADKFTSASNILDQLRVQIKLALKQTGKSGETQDGIEMALVIYFPNEKVVEFSGARNPIYIVNNENKLIIYKGDSMPIGIHLHEHAFSNTKINVTSGGMVYLFTDGVTDQMNAKGNRLMTKNLRKWLLEIYKNDCSMQETLFTQRMFQWMENAPNQLVEQIDDMLLIGFRIP
ncbi:MAG: SpoIIE family protein phosphatase [Salinivirgaceae bacterium]|nr:SpoIIE family protein phosphatase [Salinivirgaceae bacterium]